MLHGYIIAWLLVSWLLLLLLVNWLLLVIMKHSSYEVNCYIIQLHFVPPFLRFTPTQATPHIMACTVMLLCPPPRTHSRVIYLDGPTTTLPPETPLRCEKASALCLSLCATTTWFA